MGALVPTIMVEHAMCSYRKTIEKTFSGPGMRKVHSAHHQKLPHPLKPPRMNARAAAQKTKS